MEPQGERPGLSPPTRAEARSRRSRATRRAEGSRGRPRATSQQRSQGAATIVRKRIPRRLRLPRPDGAAQFGCLRLAGGRCGRDLVPARRARRSRSRGRAGARHSGKPGQVQRHAARRRLRAPRQSRRRVHRRFGADVQGGGPPGEGDVDARRRRAQRPFPPALREPHPRRARRFRQHRRAGITAWCATDVLAFMDPVRFKAYQRPRQHRDARHRDADLRHPATGWPRGFSRHRHAHEPAACDRRRPERFRERSLHRRARGTAAASIPVQFRLQLYKAPRASARGT